MMGFADDVEARVRRPGSRCSVCALLPTLDAKLRAEVVDVIRGPRSLAVVKEAAEARGWVLGIDALRKHRVGTHE